MKDVKERRIIMDLSFSKGNAVNDYIEKYVFLGDITEVIFPKVNFVELITRKGKGCSVFKKNLIDKLTLTKRL